MWDGISANGSLVDSASGYTIILRAKDKLWNIGVTKSNSLLINSW